MFKDGVAAVVITSPAFQKEIGIIVSTEPRVATGVIELCDTMISGSRAIDYH